MKDLAHQDLDTVAITYRTLEAVCATPMVPKAFQGNPHAALAAVLLGREIGLGPMTSLQQIDVIDSKPALSSELMVSLVRRSGHSVTVPSWSADACTVRGVRADNGDTVEVTFTMDDAAKAGLANKPNWQRHPKPMLYARAASQLVRTLFPDCVSAIHAYAPQDLDDEAAPPAVPIGATIVDVPEAAGSDTAELEAEMDRNALELRLAEKLAEKPDGTMDDIESLLRALVRLAERLGVVSGRGGRDFLHTALMDVGATHVSDLRRAELVNLTGSLRSEIATKFVDWIHDDDSEIPDPSLEHADEMVHVMGEVLGAVEVSEQGPE
jgi:hypothetical protein